MTLSILIEESYVLSRHRLGLRSITYNLSFGYSCLIYHSYVSRVTKSVLFKVQSVKANGDTDASPLFFIKALTQKVSQIPLNKVIRIIYFLSTLY